MERMIGYQGKKFESWLIVSPPLADGSWDNFRLTVVSVGRTGGGGGGRVQPVWEEGGEGACGLLGGGGAGCL